MNQNQPNKQSVLDQFGINLVALAQAQKLKPVIGRQQEIKQVLEVLNQMEKNNPILVGEPGVGKSAIVEAIAIAISEQQVPDCLKNKLIYSISIANLKAGASLFGEFEKRVVELVKTCETNQNIILFIDEIHLLMADGTSGANAIDLANIFKPALARGTLRLIGATTWDEFHQHLEKDRAFLRRINPIEIKAPDPKTTLTILRGLKSTYENYHNLIITDQSLIKAVEWSDRYLVNQFFPDKAITLVDRAAANLKLALSTKPEALSVIEEEILTLKIQQNALDDQNGKEAKNIAKAIKEQEEQAAYLNKQWLYQQEFLETLKTEQTNLKELKLSYRDALKQNNLEAASDANAKIKELENKLNQYYDHQDDHNLIHNFVSPKDIALTLSIQNKIPLDFLMQDENTKMMKLESSLKTTVIGQDQAISAICDQLVIAKAGFGFNQDQHKPLGSFLFVGPPGVGKTLIAKTLAKQLFGNEQALIRINMSEMAEAAAISKLIGSPPGYVGYEQPNQFADLVKQQPYSVILIDEIDKAHPDVLNLFLQILDEGQLQDSKNKLISFKNTIIIMTTNAASDAIINDPDLKPNQLLKLLKNHFKPEFLDRFKRIIKFNYLNEAQIKTVIDLELAKATINRDHHQIEFSELLKAYLYLKFSQQKQQGLRTLATMIDQEIIRPLSYQIINDTKDQQKQLKYLVDYDEEIFSVVISKITDEKIIKNKLNPLQVLN